MKILFVNACTGESSRTERLCRAFLAKLTQQHPEYEVTECNLFEKPIAYFDKAALSKRDALVEAGKLDDPMFEMAREFASAEKIVIGAPYWDLSFPAVLKCYFENICVGNIAFRYTDVGSVGLCRAEKLLYITTCGGFLMGNDFGSEYIRGLCGMFGIEAFESVAGEGLDVWGCDVEAVLKDAQARLEQLAEVW